MGTKERYDLEEVEFISAFSMGEPGKRTFFLGIGKQNNWLRIWLEKEQLQALSLGIEQLLFTLSQEHISLPREEEDSSLAFDISSALPSAELELQQITLGYEEGKATIEFLVRHSGSEDEETSAVYCRAAIAQLKKLRRQSKSIVAAGRPLCQLCGGPIDPSGHVCPRLN